LVLECGGWPVLSRSEGRDRSSALPPTLRKNAKDRAATVWSCRRKGWAKPRRRSRDLLRFFVLVPQPFDEHLFFRFVVGHEQMPNAASADKVANFFRQILGMVAGAFQRLRHKDNLQAGVMRDV